MSCLVSCLQTGMRPVHGLQEGIAFMWLDRSAATGGFCWFGSPAVTAALSMRPNPKILPGSSRPPPAQSPSSPCSCHEAREHSNHFLHARVCVLDHMCTLLIHGEVTGGNCGCRGGSTVGEWTRALTGTKLGRCGLPVPPWTARSVPSFSWLLPPPSCCCWPCPHALHCSVSLSYAP